MDLTKAKQIILEKLTDDQITDVACKDGMPGFVVTSMGDVIEMDFSDYMGNSQNVWIDANKL